MRSTLLCPSFRTVSIHSGRAALLIVRRQQRPSVLEVLSLRNALQRSLVRFAVPRRD